MARKKHRYVTNKLKYFRQLRGWTQTELAYHANVHPQTISSIETGYLQPRETLKRKIANALEIPVEKIFDIISML
jgi:DNA-binding XRE family transcriptional regulator